MANKLTNLLRKVFLGSLAGIAASNTATANTNFTFPEPNENENKFESALNRKPDLSPKLLLKKTSNDEWAFMSHRSHRSHSSHRSHYSSYSGSGSGNSTPKSNPGIQPNYNNNSSPSTSSGTSTTALQLGARTLKKGMSGTDVTELVNILLRKKYLKLDDGGTVVTGSYTIDETIEGAVKKFQSDNGLTSDGVCGSTTIYYLKNK
jgi:murein L,D-transpeptidase YcbB/YkuD